jgi:hypothetical protein
MTDTIILEENDRILGCEASQVLTAYSSGKDRLERR